MLVRNNPICYKMQYRSKDENIASSFLGLKKDYDELNISIVVELYPNNYSRDCFDPYPAI